MSIEAWTQVFERRKKFRYEKIDGLDTEKKRAYEKFKTPAYQTQRRETVTEYAKRRVENTNEQC
jgi:hypothetical protein